MNAKYLFAELRHRFRRTLLAILSVAIGVTIFISLQAYAEGYHRAARAPLTEIGADIVAQRQGKVPDKFEGIVFPHSTAPLSRAEIEDIREQPGVEKLAEAVFFWSFEPNQFLVGMGIDPEETVGPGRLKTVVREGRYLQKGDAHSALADTSYASQNQLAVGSKVRFSGQEFTIVGLVNSSQVGSVANANLYVTLEDARTLVQQAPNVSSIYPVTPDLTNMMFVKADSSRVSGVVEEIQERLGKEGLVTTPGSFEKVLGTTFQLIDRFGLLVGISGLLIALGSLVRTVTTGLWERRRDIGLMRALGWRNRDVSVQLIAETLTVTLTGWLVGTAASFLVSWGLSFSKVAVPVPWELSPTPHFLAGGAKEMQITVPMDAHINASIVALAVLFSVIGVGLISLWVSRRVTTIKPAEVLRSE